MLAPLQVRYVWVLIRQDPGPVTILSFCGSSGLCGVCSEVIPWVFVLFVFKHCVSLFLIHFETHFASQGFHRNQ